MKPGALAVGATAALLGLPLAGAIATRIATRRAERLVPADGRFREVAGARLHYVDMGEGPAIVMIHGLGAQLRNFTYGIAGRLAKRHRIICVDRPAAGYSTVLDGPHPGLAGQAAMIAGLIRSLGLERPLIVGHSLGGAVALRIALDFPELVGALALLSPAVEGQEKIPAAFRAMIMPSERVRRFAANTLAVPIGHLTKKKVQTAVFAPERCPDDFDTRGGNALLLRPVSFFGASSEISGGAGELYDQARRYPSLQRRVAILYARQDQILDPEAHGKPITKATPLATLELIEGGHMFPITKPEETAVWIEKQARALAEERSERALAPADA